MSEDKRFRIVNLRAENIKKLIAVDITPEGNIVTLAGKNGQGKSSIMDSIVYALGGGDTLPGKPIHDGAEDGVIRLDLGTLLVERTFKDEKSTLKVTAKDGAKYATPQAMLDKMMGAITFDPLAFTHMKAKDQYDTLRRLVPLAIDVDMIDLQNKNDFDNRTIISRRVRDLEGEVAGLAAKVDPEALDEKIDIVALSQEISAAKDKARHYDDLGTRAFAKKERVRLQKLEVERLEGLLATARSDLELREGEFEEADSEFEKYGPTVPKAEEIAALQTKLADANAINAKVDVAKAHIQKQADLEVAQREEQVLTERIARRNQDKLAAISAAKMPIEGLGLQDGIVTYQGFPFDQASKAEQIRVSTAIAMAMNPSLRVIRINDGALLDDDSLGDIKRLAQEKDFQVWIETVKSDDPLALVIEEGRIKGQNIEPTKAEDRPKATRKKAGGEIDVEAMDKALDAKKAAQGGLL